MNRYSRALAWTLIAFLALVPRVTAQDQKKPPLTFGAEVALIAVPVFVTDKDGRTVAGLTIKDFEVEDGGKPATVEGFLAVTGDGPVETPQGGGAAAGATLLSSRRQFVLLFDLALTRAQAIEKSRIAARKFLEEKVVAGDLVGVVTATSQGMKTLLGLSPDRTQVLRAINGVGRGDMGRDRDPLGILYDMNLQSTLVVSEQSSDVADAAAEQARAQTLLMMRQERERYAKQITTFLGGFQALARQLDSIRGRKNVILFSEGFDSTIITGAQGNEKSAASSAVTTGNLWEVDSDTYFGSATGQNAFDSLFASMRGADVVVHSIDLGSAGTDTMDLASQEGSAFTKVSGLDSLAAFASNTGGRFMKGVTDIDSALTDIASATKAYYVLAFSPAKVEVGKLRKLKIKVTRPGLRVSHRPAYLIPDPGKPDPTRQALQASEVIAKGLSGGTMVLSAYALPYRSPQNGIGVPIVIQIPAEAFIEPLKRKQINFELFGYLIDEKGTVVDYFKAAPALDPAVLAPKLKASGLQIITTFGASAGNHEIRLLVRDPTSQKFGALRIPVVVPAFPTAVFVSSPMVTENPFDRVALPTVTERRPNREIPFRIEDRPFTVEASPVLKKGDAREICVFKTPSNGKAEDFKVVLIAADGSEKLQSADGLKVLRDADGFDRIVFHLSAKGVESGEYGLKVSVGPTASQTTVLRVQ